MPEVVPQITLTKALNKTNTLDPPPQPVRPPTLNSGKDADDGNNNGVCAVYLYTYPQPTRARSSTLLVRRDWGLYESTEADSSPSNTVGAAPPNPNNDRELRDSNMPFSGAQTPSYTTMTSKAYTDEPDVSEAAIDPLSRQILQRTNTQHKLPPALYANVPVDAASGGSEPDPSAGRLSSEPANFARRGTDSSASNKLTKEKDKKKGVSFLSRFMGGKKREDSVDYAENATESSENRPTGMEAEVFSQPVGFTPRFPAPPKYIKVKAQNRREKEFDHVFLAQVLLEKETLPKSRQGSDAQIVSINATPPTAVGGRSTARKAVWATEFSKDGKYLAAAGQDKKLRVWQVISAAEDREAAGSDGNLENGGEDGIKLNAPVFKSKLVRSYEGHTSSILDLSWSKNDFLLSSSMDKTVRLYHISREECLCTFKHNDFVTSIQFHPRDDRFFLAGSLDSKLRLWSIPDKSVAFSVQAPDMVTAVAFTPDGKTAIAGCLNGVCNIYDTEGLKAHSQIYVRSARGKNAKGSKITGIDTITIPRDNPNGDVKLLITSNDSRIRLYNLRDRSLEIKFRGNENTSSQIHASFSDDGKYVICGSEDRKVYIWPTGPVEKQDVEKRPVEVFEAHSAIVTTAIMAPTKTKQLLAQSNDPIYDVCNPPPVTLLSRTESVISSRAPTESGTSLKDAEQPSSAPQNGSPRRAPPNPTYLARSAHSGGNIIVSADYTGQIKVFRQDCAFQKRRHESWDSNNSVFSKRRFARSGSVTTRTSVSSTANHRNSLTLGSSKNPSADRILNWRNSIASDSTGNVNSISDVNFSATNRARTPSPKKGHPFSKSSPRHGSTLANPPATAPSPPPSLQQDSADPAQRSIPDIKKPESGPDAKLDTAKQTPSQLTESYNPVPRQPEDPLWLQGEQSFMYWNVGNTLAPMVQHDARTPGLLSPGGNPLSRKNSVVSELSSGQLSSVGTSSEENFEDARTGPSRSGGGGEDLTCAKCGNSTFKATSGPEGQKLKCKRCGTMV